VNPESGINTTERMSIERGIVIGIGKVAAGCVDILSTHLPNTLAVEPEPQSMSYAKLVCNKRGLTFLPMAAKSQLRDFFLAIDEPTLVISAANAFLFPPEVVRKQNLRFVNFHNSLLPAHPGRNAPTWSIFAMDQETGVTWHRINETLDNGGVILQSKFPISPDVTGLELTRMCMDRGIETFRGLAPKLISGEFEERAQDRSAAWRPKRSKDVPNDGMLDLAWPIGKMYAFLRSLDYKALPLFRKPRVQLESGQFEILSYALDGDAGTRGSGTALVDLALPTLTLAFETSALRLDVRLVA
jgi:methionyl-tRNA formyltransferase